MPEEKGILDHFEAQLMDLCAKYPRRENQLAEDLGISFGWFSKVKNGKTPSRGLVASVARLHKESFSSSVPEFQEDSGNYGSGAVDLPAASLELANQQVSNGRFRDLREYLVHLISQDADRVGSIKGLASQVSKFLDGPVSHNLAKEQQPPARPKKKRNQNRNEKPKHGGN